MPRIHTIEDDFEYQVKDIIERFKKDFEVEGMSTEELGEFMWNHSEYVGKMFIEKIDEYFGEDIYK